MVLHDLSPKVRELFNSLKGKEKIRILFVCLGNICRSPAAEGMMLEVIKEHHCSDRFVIDSAGTGGYHVGQLPDPRMRAHARRRGIELTHICRRVRTSDFDDFDLIFGMDNANVDDLRELAPSVEAQNKVLPMVSMLTDSRYFDYIPDPYYDGAEGFERVLDLLDEATRNLFDTLTADSKSC